jgi:hypothetical protein
VIAAGVAVYWRVHSFNVREVLPGEVYRVAQPGIDDIEEAAGSMKLRTLVNLRGPNPKNEWYRREVEVADRLGIRLVSLRFESFDWPPRIETLQLVDTLDQAPRPLLMHCHSGVDRSGWAAGVVRLLHGDPLEAARGELSPLEGHFCDRDECALHRFFDLYEGWLARSGRAHSADTFREWVRGSYYPPPYAAKIDAEAALPAAATPGERLSIPVVVANASSSDWLATSDTQRGIRLGARILGPFDAPPADPVELFRQPRAPARDVFRDGMYEGTWKPGASRRIEVGFDAPGTPGLYYVQIDMVDEMVHWFCDLGDAGLVFPIRVGPQEPN